jgi:hypothetical protein
MNTNTNIDPATQYEDGTLRGYLGFQIEYNMQKCADTLVRVFVPEYSFRLDSSMDGLACMQHDDKRISFNPTIYEALCHEKKLKMQDDRYFHKLLDYAGVGLIAHEIGHVFYTKPFKEIAKFKPDTSEVPEEFLLYCANVVEDSHIQRRFAHEFGKVPGVKNGLLMVSALIQGPDACEQLEKTPYDKLSIKDRMMFFICRAYNPRFSAPSAWNIPIELVRYFDGTFYINDQDLRTDRIIAWSEMVYKWLEEEIKQNQELAEQIFQELGQSGGSGKGSGLTNQQIRQAIQDAAGDINKTQQQTSTQQGQAPTDANKMSQTDLAGIGHEVLPFHSPKAGKESSNFRKIMNSFYLFFRRLQTYNFNAIVRHQSRGKLDKHSLYRSTVTPNIFQREMGSKRDMDLYCGVALDYSGSMRETYSSLCDVVVPLMAALEAVKGRSELLMFSDKTYKVKDYFGKYTKGVINAVEELGREMQGTDLKPALKYFNDIIHRRKHKDKCIIIFSDGDVNDWDICSQLIENLRKFGCFVYGVGLNLSTYDGERHKLLFKGDCVIYKDKYEIENCIAPDLTKLLSEKFMKK